MTAALRGASDKYLHKKRNHLKSEINSYLKKKKINLVLVEGNNKMRTEVNKATKSIQTEPN